DRYRAACTAMLDRFDRTTDRGVANTVAWACTLAPGAVTDPERPVALARRAVAQVQDDPILVNTYGITLYRAGKFELALQEILRPVALRQGTGNEWDWLYLAMAYHRLEQPEEARTWLDKAARRIEESSGSSIPPGAAAAYTWEQRRELPLLLREARTLLA